AIGVTPNCTMEDVGLLRYLGNSSMRPVSAKELTKDYLVSEDNCAYALIRAYEEAMKGMEDTELKLYRELELPLVYVLFEMEQTGVRVDESRFAEFSKRYGEKMREHSAKIFELAGEEFNLNSPFQLSEILFEKLGFNRYGAKKNIRGGYSTNAEILEKLAEEHEIARQILSYREYQKLQSTYVDGIRPLVKGGIVHTTYNQTMTTTGRLSSANPNLQNIPVRRDEGKELRKLFIAREGNVMVDADYSQIELRLLAHFSGCKPLIEAYNEGRDIHATTASQVFGVPLSEVTASLRRRAKVVNFGIIYGMSAYGLAKDLSCSAQEAQEIIDRYFATYADVKEYMQSNVESAKRDGYVKTILGRKRWIPEINSSNYNLRSFGERAAMNMPLQGSSADIIKIAMNKVSERLKRENLQAKLVLQVHDELALDTPLGEAEQVSVLLKEEMEGAVALNVPLIAEVKTGKSWYEAK
ncbi:MAG: DNA polymerase I, partial [Clostridiales bacterium]|nr:DNA polymerase I [Clostridiales bacterium]